jgi:acyl-CoA thioesterase FadM
MDILGLSTVRFRCWPNDLDTNFHMNNGRYMTLLDLGRLDLLLRTGAAAPAFKRKWYPVLAAVQMRFRKPLNLFQKFEIRTRIVTWDAKFVYLEQKIMREGNLVTHAWLKGAFVGPKGTVPMAELVELLGHKEPPPPLPEEMQAWAKAEAAMAETTRQKAT